MPETDADDVRLCLNGHPDIFRNLVTRYQAPLFKHLSGKLNDHSDATEAAQETLVRAYFALPKLRQAKSFLSWLLGIADRVAGEMYRARRHDAVALDSESLVARAEAPLESNGRSDEQLTRAVSELPEDYRDVILRRFYGSQSCAEISANLGVSLGTVTSRLSRAYVLLRKTLQELDQET